MTAHRFLFRATGILLGIRLVSVAIGVAASALLARWLAPEGYGTYLYILTVAQFLALPILAGLPTLAERQIAIARGARDPSALTGMLKWSAVFLLITATVVYAGVLAFDWLRGTAETSTVARMTLPLIGALAILHTVGGVLRGYERPVAATLPDGLIRPALVLVSAAVLHATGLLSSGAAIWAYSASALAAALWGIWHWLRHCRREVALGAPRYSTRAWLGSLVPLSLTTGAAAINSKVDILMLGVFSDVTEIALYGIAVQIAGLVIMVQTIVNGILGPRIGRLYSQNRHGELQAEIRTAVRLSSAAAFGVFAVIGLTGAWVLDTLLGTGYGGSLTLLLILGLGNVATSCLGPAPQILDRTGHERITAKVVWIAAVGNVILNLILIPWFGALGAAMATIVTQLLRQAYLTVWVYSNLSLNTVLTLPGRRAR